MQSLSNEDSAPGAESNVRWTGLRLFVVERMPLDVTSQHHVAKWVMSEAEARGLDAELVGADGLSQLTEAGLAGGAVALIMVYPVSSDWGSIDSAVPWEAWSQLTSAAAELGATVALVDAGLRPAGVAMCLKNGASAVVPVDRVREALDLLSERSEASLGCDVSLGAVLGERFSDERIDRLTRLTTIELPRALLSRRGVPGVRHRDDAANGSQHGARPHPLDPEEAQRQVTDRRGCVGQRDRLARQRTP